LNGSKIIHSPDAVFGDGFVNLNLTAAVVPRLILSNLSDTVLITDETGAFTYICPNIECIFGYSSQEAQELGNIANLLGNDFFELDTFGFKIKMFGSIPNVQKHSYHSL
jgi:hypothetical protein